MGLQVAWGYSTWKALHMNSLIVSSPEKMKWFYWRCLPEESLVTLMEKGSDKSLSDDRDGDQSRSPVTAS